MSIFWLLLACGGTFNGWFKLDNLTGFWLDDSGTLFDNPWIEEFNGWFWLDNRTKFCSDGLRGYWIGFVNPWIDAFCGWFWLYCLIEFWCDSTTGCGFDCVPTGPILNEGELLLFNKLIWFESLNGWMLVLFRFWLGSLFTLLAKEVLVLTVTGGGEIDVVCGKGWLTVFVLMLLARGGWLNDAAWFRNYLGITLSSGLLP